MMQLKTARLRSLSILNYIALSLFISCAGREPQEAVRPYVWQGPVEVELGSRALSIDSDGFQTCASLESNTVKCWGLVGNKTMNGSGPSLFGEYQSPVSVFVGNNLSCTVESGIPHCSYHSLDVLGYHMPDSGEYPLGAGFERAIVENLGFGVAEIAFGEKESCARGVSNRVICVNPNLSETESYIIYTLDREFRQISVGGQHFCGIDLEYEVFCWGAAFGITGVTTTLRQSEIIPTHVSVGSKAKYLQAGGNYGGGFFSTGFNCILDFAGEVWCWGSTHFGEGVKGYPSRVTGIPPSQDIDLGWYHACAVSEDGKVYCWGDSIAGQAGEPVGDCSFDSSCTVATPQLIAIPFEVTSVAVGAAHSCAMSVEGRVFCWGDNSFGQLGKPNDSIERPKILCYLVGQPTPDFRYCSSR